MSADTVTDQNTTVKDAITTDHGQAVPANNQATTVKDETVEDETVEDVTTTDNVQNTTVTNGKDNEQSTTADDDHSTRHFETATSSSFEIKEEHRSAETSGEELHDDSRNSTPSSPAFGFSFSSVSPLSDDSGASVRRFPPQQTSPRITVPDEVYCKSFAVPNRGGDNTCLGCGEAFDFFGESRTCARPSCRRPFCNRCMQNASSKGVSLITESGFCAICEYQQSKRPTLAVAEWHWTFNDHGDLEFTRTLRDALPTIPGLFLEIHAMRQACWRRRIGGMRKHYSFKQHGGFFEGRLQALNVTTSLPSGHHLMGLSPPGMGRNSPLLMGSISPSSDRSPLYGLSQSLPHHFVGSNLALPPSAVSLSHGSMNDGDIYGDMRNRKRKYSSNTLVEFPNSRRSMKVQDSHMMWNPRGHYLQQFGMIDNQGYQWGNEEGRNGVQHMSDWNPNMTGVGISEYPPYNGTRATPDTDEPRCAICCEFVTKRSTHVCTCQIPSCSRVLCLHCVRECADQRVPHFNPATGCCAICQYQGELCFRRHTLRSPESWHTEFSPILDRVFLTDYTNSLPSIPSVWFDVNTVSWQTERESFPVATCGGLFEARWVAVQSLYNQKNEQHTELPQEQQRPVDNITS